MFCNEFVVGIWLDLVGFVLNYVWCCGQCGGSGCWMVAVVVAIKWIAKSPG